MKKGFISFVIPLLGLVLLMISGSAAFGLASSSTGDYVNLTGEGLGGQAVFTGTGFLNDLTPPVDPADLDHYNGKIHGNTGHKRAGCSPFEDKGDVDFYVKSNHANVYAVADGVVHQIINNFVNSGGLRGADILRVYHNGYPDCSVYMHIDVDPGLKVGSTITRGQKVGNISSNVDFVQHLHFMAPGYTDGDYARSMNALRVTAGLPALPIDPRIR